jgi:iron complex outermembrane recepter protein
MRPQAVLLTLVLSVVFGAGAPVLAMSPPSGEKGSTQESQTETTPGETTPDETTPTFRQTIEVTTTPDLPQEVRASGEEITERNPVDLAEVLRNEPGLDALRQGPINLDPQVRALRETQLLVLVDGTRTFPAGPARMDSEMSHVDPEMVQSLRIVKGPYALSWGGGALAAIAVDTFEAPFQTAGTDGGARLTLGYGDNADSRNAGALGWLSGERWRLTLLHDSRQGHDYESGGGETVPGDYASHTSRWTLGTQPRPGAALTYRGGYQRQDDIDYPGRLLDATYFVHRSHSLEGSWQRPGGSGRVQVFGQLYSSFKDHLMNNDGKPSALPAPGRMPPFPLDVRFPTASDTVGGRTFASWTAAGLDLQAGLDAFHLEQQATRRVARRDTGALLFVDTPWPDVEIDHAGVHLQATLPRARWSLSGTVRVDDERASVGSVSELFQQEAGGELDSDDTEVSASLAARWQAGRSWSLMAGAGRVVRFPTALERYSDRFPGTRYQISAEFLGDPALEPEEAVQLDLGATWAAGTTSLDVQVFYRVVDQPITLKPDPSLPRRLPSSPPVVYRFVNGDRATWWGGEAQLRGSLGDAWSWRTGLSWIRGEDDTFDEPAFGVPPLVTHLGLRWQPADRPLWADLSARIADDQDRPASSLRERPTAGSTLLSLHGGYRISSHWSVRAGLDNLLDEDFANHLNPQNPFTGERVPEPGRSFSLGVTLSR